MKQTGDTPPADDAPDPGGFLFRWVRSLQAGYTLTDADVHRLQRVALQLSKAAQHHEQARMAMARDSGTTK